MMNMCTPAKSPSRLREGLGVGATTRLPQAHPRPLPQAVGEKK